MNDSRHPDPAAAAADADDLADADADADAPEADDAASFAPVPVRYRHNGWVPDRQLAFIEALADCGCVDEAVKAVGMSRNSAYALRRRPDAQAFRLAWDAALDNAVVRLSDAAMSRAINGVAVPVFHAGAQIGERRHFDERLTMFLLRYRDPVRYGKWLDGTKARQHQDGPTAILAFRVGRMLRAAWRAFDAALNGDPTPPRERENVDRGTGDDQDCR